MYENSPNRSATGTGRDPLVGFVERFVNSLPSGGSDYLTDSTPGERSWLPPVDIFENDDAFTVTLDLPGLSKKNIDISLEDNVLTVSGERKPAEGDGTYRRVERAYGTFRRSFTLPRDIDSAKVEARFEDGVLTLTMPKSEVAKSRKIAIS